MSIISELRLAIDVLKKEGVARVVKLTAERVIREALHLPDRTIVIQNAVAVRAGRLFDQQDVFPDTEAELVKHVRSFTEHGDDVVVIGGGSGVSAVWEAQQVGEDGSVTVYEGSENAADLCVETARLNGVDHIVSVHHALVGSAVQVRGSVGDAEYIPPENLPDCDGAEIDIISEVEIRPKKIIVETHGKLGTPPEDVRETLTQLRYEIIRSDVHSKENGISLLTAIRSDINSS